jgi:hypothetical protein
MNTVLEYSTRVIQEGGRRCKKSTLNDLVHLNPLRIPLMNPPLHSSTALGWCEEGRRQSLRRVPTNTYLLLCFKALRKPPVNLSLCTIARSRRDFLRGVRCTVYIREVFLSRHIRDRRPGRLPAQLSGLWGQMNRNSVRRGEKLYLAD